ncbi:bacterioferritin comigratory protein [Nitratireductor indicus C115]|uniref:thioredoxin-dependent peroxiredoxin n=1 Tax=Nitratireductor indicus C115 TaxID=1231190 RepID=K2NTJ2_9HYPH|nr:peroxiredoxin [Nitratireductor indicus]EKF41094.1 bacterioferritin comigratory protein [Nitratireductor indicus C115]SFQ74344.1 peroxiredoxin Q/BCP [Nitratireductor indicus]
MAELVKGSEAPDFSLPSDGGGEVKLSDLRGKIVVLFCYPKDDTSGCTAEAIDFSALRGGFEAIGAVVIGLSPDSPKSHDKFKAKHELNVQLASDQEKEALQAYGVWVEKSMYGRKYMGVERSTFLIDKNGKIAEMWRKVKVPGHAQAVLTAAQNLSKEG